MGGITIVPPTENGMEPVFCSEINNINKLLNYSPQYIFFIHEILRDKI